MSTHEDKQQAKHAAAIKQTWRELKANEDEHKANREAWPGLVMAFGKKLLAGRNTFRSGAKGDLEFGKWLTAEKLDDIPKDRRAAYLNLARNEAKGMGILKATTSKSVRLIWDALDTELNPEKPKAKRLKARKAAKQARKAKGRSTNAQTVAIKKEAREKVPEHVPCFTVSVLSDAPEKVTDWLSQKFTEIKKHHKSIEALWLR